MKKFLLAVAVAFPIIFSHEAPNGVFAMFLFPCCLTFFVFSANVYALLTSPEKVLHFFGAYRWLVTRQKRAEIECSLRDLKLDRKQMAKEGYAEPVIAQLLLWQVLMQIFKTVWEFLGRTSKLFVPLVSIIRASIKIF